MKRPMSPCALCLQAKSLVQSHIIPSFLLKESEDWIEKGESRQKHPHLTLVDFKTATEVYSHQRGKVLKKEGLIEYLLCEECEKRLKVGEDYARFCLFGREHVKKHPAAAKTLLRYRARRGKVVREGFEVRWVDYEQLKQFQIGIIWRACVANGPAFRCVEAADATRERMRLALLGGALDEDLVPCAVERLYNSTDASLGIISLPVAGDKRVNLVMGGYRWHFYMDGNAPPEVVLRKSGRLLVRISDIDCFYTPDDMFREF